MKSEGANASEPSEPSENVIERDPSLTCEGETEPRKNTKPLVTMTTLDTISGGQNNYNFGTVAIPTDTSASLN